MKHTHPIDQACAMLREYVKDQGLYSVDIIVRNDGRVELIGKTVDGYTRGRARGDLHEDALDQLPSAAFCDLRDGGEGTGRPLHVKGSTEGTGNG